MRSRVFTWLLLVAGLSAAAAAQQPDTPDLAERLLRFVGRLHPIFVHFPIALFVSAAMIEVVRASVRRPTPAKVSLVMLLIGLAGASGAIWSGWLNGDFENHASVAQTMELHRWIAIGASGCMLVALIIGLLAGRRPKAAMAFRAILVIGAGAACLAGHFGGTMVYGEGYFFAPLQSGEVRGSAGKRTEEDAQTRPMNIDDVSFERDVLPIFEARCVECHGAGRARASLRLDSLEHAMNVDGWIIAPGDPGASDLVARITMPERIDGAMPPEGDRLTSAQIEAIRLWIASLNEQAAESLQPQIVDEPPPADAKPPASKPYDSPEQAAAAIESVRAAGGRVERVSADSMLLDVNLSLAGTNCTDKLLIAMAPIASSVQWLDLSRTAVTDIGMASLKGCTSLDRINLSGTGITDTGFVLIGGLPELRVINVTNTAVSDAGLIPGTLSRSMLRIYGWQSRITPEGAAGFMAVRSDVLIELGASELSVSPDSASPTE